MTRLSLIAAAGLIAGTVPTTGTSSAARTAGSAMVDAVLHAITTSRGRYRSTSRPSNAGTRAAISASLLVPYGKPAESAA